MSIKEDINKGIAKKRKISDISPTRLIVFSFVTLILTGATLLTLPMASNDGRSIGFINALFTATSASCVTGLVIADTKTQWTLFGQIVILVMIQVGGLGIITLATFFSVLLGRKVSMKGRVLAQESISYFSLQNVLGLIKGIVLVTIYIEFIGALLLSSRFVPQYGIKGLYMGVFHSISAFCNAGFDLIGGYRSLTDYNNDPIVIYTTALLIIIGGLGFMVWRDLYEHPNLRGLFLHTKLVLIMTGSLIFGGAIFFMIFEYANQDTMGSLNIFGKINSAFFQSVTCRTAGYNSLPINSMTEVSKMGSILLMFIGAAPGSTGGGIKVTTAGVILMAIISNIRGHENTIVLDRRIPNAVVNKALAIAGLSLSVIFVVTTMIIGIEKMNFINVLFEVTSAFGTVGLSTGITPTLHTMSKLLLIFTMFLGRVGPLTFAVAIALKARKENKKIIYPEGKIMVG
ncbi:MAG: TrkH family potassium uptake protein [Eubacteriales bacterium]